MGLKINAIFDVILEAFWLPFWNPNGAFWDIIFDSFLDSANNGAPHKNIVNSSQIEGRPPGKATKTHSKNEEKTVRKRS